MPLVTTGMTRKFTFRHGAETITLDDPDPRMSPDRIMTTATVHGPKIENDEAIYEFKTTIGVKG